MTTQKTHGITKKIKLYFNAGLLFIMLVPLSLAFADGYGVMGANNKANTENSMVNLNNAKIDALLGGIHSGRATPKATVDANAVAQSRNQAQPSPTASPYGNDPVGERAFATMARNLLPLTPQQIKTLHYLFNKSQQAAAQYPGIPPKPTSTSLIVNLSPGAAPPVIRLSQGFVSSLVFVDATGAPWPIQAYDLGNQHSFNIQWDKKGNTLMVQALDRYKPGNLAVMLRGLDTPIMITLMPGQHAVDYRVDLRVPKIGPNANPVLEGLPNVESPSLMNVLNGIPPQGSRALVIKGGDAQAWMVGNTVYLRTPMTVLSPAFISTMSSLDGTHAYEIQATPVILALSRGKTIKLTIEGL